VSWGTALAPSTGLDPWQSSCPCLPCVLLGQVGLLSRAYLATIRDPSARPLRSRIHRHPHPDEYARAQHEWIRPDPPLRSERVYPLGGRTPPTPVPALHRPIHRLTDTLIDPGPVTSRLVSARSGTVRMKPADPSGQPATAVVSQDCPLLAPVTSPSSRRHSVSGSFGG
jgi:hypothetical protein